jgi:hypothetical protein
MLRTFKRTVGKPNILEELLIDETRIFSMTWKQYVKTSNQNSRVFDTEKNNDIETKEQNRPDLQLILRDLHTTKLLFRSRQPNFYLRALEHYNSVFLREN